MSLDTQSNSSNNSQQLTSLFSVHMDPDEGPVNVVVKIWQNRLIPKAAAAAAVFT
jgi:hypothetical protein